MIKPYLYGGLALLIVGLFSFGAWTQSQLDSTRTTLLETQEVVNDLRVANNELIASSARKVGAAAAYQAMTDWVGVLASNSVSVIKGYRARETENEKCLDLRPPSTLVEQLRGVYSDRVSGEDSKGKAK